ncbi:UPF0182 family protein [Alicyclobacillus sp. ALC3]|uniref:UPF0182 family protein n=1 Tax=Alicyclobacillus sp. ALC3 TaxID=2796143 RepID=UPI0023797224|nr:UPF0182 family protein [Alicyclobacillus sp. ALC3]WDL99067.1 UPF0182 family protein [Alicyclobacillus sp. ALC3]
MVRKIRTQRSSKPLIVTLVIIAAIVFIHVALDRLYAFRLHGALGYGAIYAKNMWFELATRYLGAALYAGLAFLAVRPFTDLMPKAMYRALQVLAVVLGWIIGFGMWHLQPTAWFLFFHHQPFHYRDPLLHIDMSFYVYQLPLLIGLVGRMIGTLALWLVIRLLTVVGAFLHQQTQITKPNIDNVIHRQARLSLTLLGVLFILFAVMTYLNRFTLMLTSGNGSFVYGPDYVQAHFTLPIFSWLHILLLLITAAAILWQARHIERIVPTDAGFSVPSWRSFRRPLYSFAFYVASVVLSGVVASLVNALYVHPNQNTVELPYINDSIQATRWALGIDHVATQPLSPSPTLTQSDVAASQGALDNVRVNDQGQTTNIYNQLQSLKNYFQFTTAAVDRYNGTEVYVSARQMNVNNLPVQTWVNRTFVYTHGYGIAASPVNKFDAAGLPVFLAQNTPQQTSPPLPHVTRPQIYFGLMNNNVIAPSKQPEFDYPVGNGDHASHYQGGYGLPIRGNRLLLTIEQGNLKYYTSQQFTSKSQWLFDRNIYQRVQAIAPFLTYDHDAYPFINSAGHIEWILDAYTESANIPYAQSFMGTGYIRNSVKVVMDAYTGKVTFYVVNRHDPMLQSLAAAYPSLFTYKIPADVSAHFRYPTDLFDAQANALARYHMTNPSSFYNQDDLWQQAQQIYNQNQTQTRPPVYQMLQMPGQKTTHFVLSELFTPQTKENLNAWLVADNGPVNYGQLTLYQFPQSSLFFGPMQAENQIDSNPTISAQMSLWNQQGSHVVRGNLLLIPLGNTLLYVEPVYLVADRSNSLPQLERVIVDSNKQVYMDTSLGAAIADVLSGTSPTSINPNTPGGTAGGSTSPGTGAGSGGTSGSVGGTGSTTYSKLTTAQLITQANTLFAKYQQDTASGQLAQAGTDLKNLQTVLNLLNARAGSTQTGQSGRTGQTGQVKP